MSLRLEEVLRGSLDMNLKYEQMVDDSGAHVENSGIIAWITQNFETAKFPFAGG